MTREEAIGIMNYLKHYAETDIKERDVSEEKDRIRFIEALDMAIQALENHDTFMKYAYSQGKQDALSQEPISLNDINNALGASFRNGVRSAKVEQEPCDDAISRKDAEQMFRNIRSHLKPQDYKSAEEFNTRDLMLLNAEQMIHALPSVKATGK